MKYLKVIVTNLCVIAFFYSSAQEFTRENSIAVHLGMINYQGDLKPKNFTFNHSNITAGIVFTYPLNKFLSLRSDFRLGTIEGADRYNRFDLKKRNLSFYSSIKELSVSLELNLTNTRLSPYFYLGAGIIHMNPWTYDEKGNKTFLHPLSTEGQGLPGYPNQEYYKLLQPILPFGCGLKYVINNAIKIGIEFSQRKSFTDYLDDVSTYFVDKDALLDIKGPLAVALSYCADELPGGNQEYPVEYSQRGFSTKMDWYYFLGTSIEVNFTALKELFKKNPSRHFQFGYIPCPK